MSRTEILAATKDHPLLFFDGVCGLCNVAVDWIIAHDPDRHFRFAPLQGSTAIMALDQNDRENLKTLVLIRDGKAYRRSSAVLQIARDLEHLPLTLRCLAHLAWLVPSPLRDLAYAAVARVRYRIWGKKEVCRLPSKAERALFFD